MKEKSFIEHLKLFLQELQTSVFLGVGGLLIVKYAKKLAPVPVCFLDAVGALILFGAAMLSTVLGAQFFEQATPIKNGFLRYLLGAVITALTSLLFWASLWQVVGG